MSTTIAPARVDSKQPKPRRPVVNGEPKRGKSPLYRQSAAAFRWFHIYLSMLSFAALLFFAFTGITLNHPTWFGGGEQSIVDSQGHLPDGLIADGTPNQLAIAEHLRATHGLKGRVTDFTSDEYESMVVFKGPGYAADVFIDHQSNDYTVSVTTSAMIAVMNDLHKGRDSGPQWSFLIDAAAVVLILMSVSGFGLLFYLKKKRTSGVMVSVVGTIALFLVWAIWVP